MRATYLVFRLVAAGCLLTSAGSCAEGGISDAELNGNVDPSEDDAKDGGTSGAGSSKDASKDAKVSTGGDGTSTGSTGSKDASTGGTGSTGSKDASTGGTGSTGSKDASTGGGGGGAPIKCPSSMVCNTSLSGILSILDSTIKSGTNLCATSGGIIPASVSCMTVDTCKSSNLVTATCSAGSCIQPCTP